MSRDASLRSLRIFRGLKLACKTKKQNVSKAAAWSHTNEGRAAFGEVLTDDGIRDALLEIEEAINEPKGTLFGRGKAAKGQKTLRVDNVTAEKLRWADEVIAAYEKRKAFQHTSNDEVLSISSENFVSVAVLSQVTRRFHEVRQKKGKSPVRIVVHELPSLRAAKDDHERGGTALILHSARPAAKSKRQSWTKEEGLTLLKRKVDGIKTDTAICLPDMVFIPRTKKFEKRLNEILGDKEPEKTNELSLTDLAAFPVALIGHRDDVFEAAIPISEQPRVVVDSLAAGIRLVETQGYVGVMNCFGVKLLRNPRSVLVLPLASDRPPVYLQVYHSNNVSLSEVAREFVDAIYRWLFDNTPGPKPKKAATKG
jgi:hypothetical protein